jgi:hypothetical protein
MSKIYIKPSHRGKLHSDLGVPAGKPIPASKLAIKSGDSTAVKKRKQFAINAKKWHHGQDGVTMQPTNPYNWYTPEQPMPQIPQSGYAQFPNLPKIDLTTLPGSTVPSTLNIPKPPELLTYPNKKKKSKFDVGDAAVTGLLAIDALIPPEPSPYPVVRPGLSYNEHPYGTGSQAIAQKGTTIPSNLYKTNKSAYVDSVLNANKNLDWVQRLYEKNPKTVQIPGQPHPSTHFMGDNGQGYVFPTVVNKDGKLQYLGDGAEAYARDSNTGIQFPKEQGTWFANNGYKKGKGVLSGFESGGNIPISTTGYKSSSKDKNKANLRIPSNQITMKGVPHNVLGTDSLGFQQLMTPGNDYTFPGSYVDEIPMAKMGSTLSSDKAKEMLRDGTAHGKKLTGKQKRYFGYIAGGGTPQAEDGMTILDQNTVKFNGDKHSDPSGGIPISYGGKNVMVEGDETGYLSPMDNSLTIMGNMKNPLTGRKFKSDSKILSEKEAKMDRLQDEGLTLINDNNPMDKWSSLKFNSGKVMATGANKKKEELLASKEHLKDIQEAMLGLSMDKPSYPNDEFGVSQKAKKGLRIDSYQSGGTLRRPKGNATMEPYYNEQEGLWHLRPRTIPTTAPTPSFQPINPETGNIPWKYNDTKIEGLDPKIKEFTDLLTKKGITGYSGPESGVSQRNTKQGRASRHASGEALDAFMFQPDAYNKVLADPELSKYLIDNGLTAINEYDPNVAKQTGATAGHLHIGYDKGTSVSDQFRKDALAKYKSSNPTWGWGTTRNPKGKAIQGAPQGDQTFFPYDPGQVSFKDILQTWTPPEGYKPPQKNPIPQYDPTAGFKNPAPYHMPSNAQPLELNQVLPELYAAATNKVEPVHLQKYQPELFEPYQVSYQDQLNENQATFSATQKAAAYNPSALATLGAQKYSADSGVLANEFRTNQGIANDITNKNIQLLNDAEYKNLGLADTQYTRQSPARSNTKAIDHDVLNSISSKILQNKLNQNKTRLYENLYNYRFHPDNLEAYNAGPGGQEYVDWTGSGNGNSGENPNQSTSVRRDAYGRVQGTTTNTPSIKTQQLQDYNIQMKRNTPVASMLNKGGLSKNLAAWLATQSLQ